MERLKEGVIFQEDLVFDITPEVASENARRLIELYSRLLRMYQKAYYQLSESWITDYEFDMMLQKLGKLEDEFPEHWKEDSPTNSVGN